MDTDAKPGARDGGRHQVGETYHGERQEDIAHWPRKVGEGGKRRDASLGSWSSERPASPRADLHHPTPRRIQNKACGTATHPPEVDGATYDQSPPSDSPSPSETPNVLAASTAPSSTPAQTQLPIREGTSEARYEQQGHTHASGQLAEGTPDAAVVDHGHGDKTVTMEPNTIGQAPKQMPLPEPEQPAAPGYLAQAQNVAAQATGIVASTVSSVAGAVTGAVSGTPAASKEDDQPVRTKSPAEQQLDQQIDASKDANVEVFLREQNRSKA
ncbi:hypothetical protein B5807_08623 [Epicoccum nigrum]|uniref:Uncharacterized protein n=1 Tax=Epicoccum nigrum TaxID=105696 RepID=A0A1Y2LRI2_EPING|nr:hypothetical protein B5807_08623 [Epicoccum nigrum]